MTNEIKEKKERNKYPDRLSVTPANLEKIGRLVDELRTCCRGCDINRKDMLNYLIERTPERLSPADIKELSSRYYDEAKFLKSALDELKAARVRGESVSLESLLQRNHAQTAQPKASRKRKAKVLESEPTSDVAHPLS